jgi:hypothetical protein
VVEEPNDLMESERLKEDIDRTRARMGGTIDEIQERLTPSRLLHDATATVREAGVDTMKRALFVAGQTAGRTAGRAKEASAAAAGYARTHPLPAALMLAGAALAMARVFAGRRAHPQDWDDTPRGGRQPANDTRSHPDYQDWAEPSNTTRSTATSMAGWVSQNPLAVGAAVAAAGTVAGLRWANRPGQALGDDTVRR